MRRDAAQAVATAATAYLALLRADPNASHTEVARVDGLLMAAEATVTAMQAAIDRHGKLSGGKGELQDAQAALTAATDPAGMLEAANAVIEAADAYLALLNADPSTAHSEITRVENAKAAAMMARADAEAAIAQANQDQMAAQELADARAALASAKATYMTVNNAAASTSQDRLDAANAMLMAAQELAALDPDSAGEVTTAQAAVDMAQAAVDAEDDAAMAAQRVQDARTALATAKSAAMIANGSVSATAMQRLDAAQAVLDAAIALHDLLVAQNASNSDVAAAATEVATARTGLDVAQAAVDAEDAAAMAAQALQDARDDLAAAQQAVMDLPADATPEARRDAALAVLDAARVVRGLLGDGATHGEVTAAQQAVDAAQAALDTAQQAVLDAEEERARLAAAAQRLQEARDALAAAKQAVMDLPGDATSQQQLDAANAVLSAAQTLASLDSGAAMEVTDAQAAVDVAQAKVTADQNEAERMAALQNARDALAAAKQAEAVLPANATAEARRDAAQAVLTAAQGVRAVLVSQDAPHSEIAAADAEIMDATEDLAMAQMAVDEANAKAMAAQALQAAKDDLTAKKQAVMDLPDNATPQQKLDAAKAVEEAAKAYRNMLGENEPYSVVNAADGEVTAAEAAVMTAQAAVDELEAAQMALTAAKQAEMGLAEDATLQEKLDAAKAVRDAAQDVADLLPGDTDAAEAVTMAQTAVDEAQGEVDMAMATAATEAAKTKAAAIAVEAAQTAATDGGLGGNDAFGADTAPGGGDDTYSLDIKRDKVETTVMVADSAMADDDDPKFMQTMDLGGGRTMHVRVNSDDANGKVEEVVIVRTDIEAPKATPFAEVTGQTLTVDTTGAIPTDTDDIVAFDPGSALVSTTPADATILANMMSASFAPGAGSSTVLTFNAAVADDTGTPEIDETMAAAEVAGTYNGAMGTYKCTGTTDCTVTVDDKGKLTAASDGWIFTPAAGATSDVADANYLSYGFWLKKTTKDGETTYNEVDTYAMAEGHPETVDADVGAVVGMATYSGDAVGVYVKNVTDEAGAIVSATSGHFVADLMLDAKFGGGGVPANDQSTISGSITDFVLSNGEANDWEVGLRLTDFSGRTGNPGETGPGTVPTNEFSGVAIGDSTAANGTWNGAFYGSSAATDHDNDNTTPDINPQPAAVIGEFNANFTDGAVAGGYGANKD